MVRCGLNESGYKFSNSARRVYIISSLHFDVSMVDRLMCSIVGVQ